MVRGASFYVIRGTAISFFSRADRTNASVIRTVRSPSSPDAEDFLFARTASPKSSISFTYALPGGTVFFHVRASWVT